MATYKLTLGGEEHELEVEEQDAGYRVKLDDTWYELGLERMGDSARYSLLLDKNPTDVFAEEGPNSRHQARRLLLGHAREAPEEGAGQQRPQASQRQQEPHRPEHAAPAPAAVEGADHRRGAHPVGQHQRAGRGIRGAARDAYHREVVEIQGVGQLADVGGPVREPAGGLAVLTACRCPSGQC